MSDEKENIAISPEDEIEAMRHNVMSQVYEMKASAERERADVLLRVVRGIGPLEDEKRIPSVRVADKLDAFAYNLGQMVSR
jgi:hypothetical protein